MKKGNRSRDHPRYKPHQLIRIQKQNQKTKNLFLKGKTFMKNTFNRIFAIAMAFVIILSLGCFASAATAENAVIDYSKTGSLSIYKYDMTTATEDGVYDASFVSTGLPDEAVEELYAPYAIEGVEFTYLRMADLITYTNEERNEKNVIVLYGFEDSNASIDLLDALALDDSDAHHVDDNGVMWFESDTLISALSNNLTTRETQTKNALEALVANNGGTAMAETDEDGYTDAEGLELGLYLVVETRVPENVTNTTAPFFVSVPMTTIDGDNWNYDVTIYPKNMTGEPTLYKGVRESAEDTGNNDGSTDDIHDGYSYFAHASEGDVVEYQIISKLPSITSDATELSVYTFVDTLSKGIEYNKNDVKIEWFSDEECTELINSWTESDEAAKFTVSYGTAENDATTMTITMTEAGLNEINNSEAVYGKTNMFSGYSDCYLRITYAATVNSSADTVLGKNGNPNTVELTWKRTNSDYWDTLDAHAIVYTFGIELTKTFSDNNGDVTNVEFVVYNESDGYWLVAEYNEDEGVYYVTGHTENENAATHFIPNSDTAKVLIKGTEVDEYKMTETKTDDGYVLLTAPVEVDVDYTVMKTGTSSSLRVIAQVNAEPVTMLADNGSSGAIVPLTVVNTKGFNLPVTGDNGVWMYGVIGVALMAAAAAAIVVVSRKKKTETD